MQQKQQLDNSFGQLIQFNDEPHKMSQTNPPENLEQVT